MRKVLIDNYDLKARALLEAVGGRLAAEQPAAPDRARAAPLSVRTASPD